MQQQSQELGTESIGKLLLNQALPASVGIFVMSIYSIVDTIFVGRYVGTSLVAYWYLNRTLNRTLRKELIDKEGTEKHLINE